MKKRMKPRKTAWMLLVAFFALAGASCSEKENAPLSLHMVENNTISLYYGSKNGVTIIGGDGNYSFSCNSPLLKAEMTHSNYILFEALDVGNAVVTINDQAGNTYILNVTITYMTESVVVVKTEATVTGDNMTVGAQKELKEKALATIPVETGGGYKFTYTGNESRDTTQGTVLLYPKSYGGESIEGTFERMTVRKEDGTYSYHLYVLHYQHIDRTFIFMPYDGPQGKSIGFQAYQFAEDLKERFQAEYPEVENVYTSQLLLHQP